MLEQAIADFYEALLTHDIVTVYIIGNEYFINNSGTGTAFDKGEIEMAEMATSLPVEYIRLS